VAWSRWWLYRLRRRSQRFLPQQSVTIVSTCLVTKAAGFNTDLLLTVKKYRYLVSLRKRDTRGIPERLVDLARR
jgi:hypothetical protein